MTQLALWRVLWQMPSVEVAWRRTRWVSQRRNEGASKCAHTAAWTARASNLRRIDRFFGESRRKAGFKEKSEEGTEWAYGSQLGGAPWAEKDGTAAAATVCLRRASGAHTLTRNTLPNDSRIGAALDCRPMTNAPRSAPIGSTFRAPNGGARKREASVWPVPTTACYTHLHFIRCRKRRKAKEIARRTRKPSRRRYRLDRHHLQSSFSWINGKLFPVH